MKDNSPAKRALRSEMLYHLLINSQPNKNVDTIVEEIQQDQQFQNQIKSINKLALTSVLVQFNNINHLRLFY